MLASLFLLLAACQTPPQTKALLAENNFGNRQHTILNVPFYPQQAFFCGPTTLSEISNFYGGTDAPEDIAPATFIPDLEGTLQVEMIASARQNGLLAYAGRGSLSQLLGLAKDNIPVIVLQNNSISLFPMWHYAVVIGYDLAAESIILHTGETKAHRLKLATFERTWQRANYWFLAAIPGSVSSQHFDKFIYTKAAQDLLSTGQINSGLIAMQRASQEWTDYWLPYFLLGNHYLATSFKSAVNWYKKGYQLAQTGAQTQVSYLNNYAYALAKLGCKDKANSLIEQALALKPGTENLLDTKAQIHQSEQLNVAYCHGIHLN
ncbi:MAG: tetratricopeptide (TPR) repeat protein [Paraglaciecola sp.]|jgi:tetratricopeptide (TPR) repeat protein